MLLFQVASFESRDGRPDDALGHLLRAIEFDPSLREAAASDADFDDVREAVSEL